MVPTFLTTFKASDFFSIFICPVGLSWSIKIISSPLPLLIILRLLLGCMKENRAEKAPAVDKNGNDEVFRLFYMQGSWPVLFFHGQKHLLLITNVAPLIITCIPNQLVYWIILDHIYQYDPLTSDKFMGTDCLIIFFFFLTLKKCQDSLEISSCTM